MSTVHLLIKGKVQGVFYRATAKEVAQKLGLKGWVRNTADSHVEAIVTGEEKAVQHFTDWANEGPKNARVTEVLVTKIDVIDFSSFEIRRG